MTGSPVATTGKRAPRKPSRSTGTVSPFGRGDVASSLVLIFPLFFGYAIGVMFAETMNGVDFVSRFVYRIVGYDRTYYFLVHLGMAVAFLGVLIYLRKKRALSLKGVPSMLLESAIYSLTLGTLIIFVMDKLLGFSALGPNALSLGRVGEAIVTSMGAGVHEEIVFRLGLMAGGAALLMYVGFGRGLSIFIALAVSSLVFSGVHHIGPLGDEWDAGVFTYRTLAGVVFGVIFYFRSLAHAVYTHFFYDVYVLLLRS